MHIRSARIACLLIASPVAILAQRWEVAPTIAFIRPSQGGLGSLPENSSVRDTDTKLKQGPGAGLRVTWNTRGYYGFEGAYIRARHTLSARVTPVSGASYTREDRIYTDYASFNGLCYFMPAGERWRPFITAGANFQNYGDPNYEEWTAGSSRNYGANFGGGIKLMLMKNVLVRFDFRDYLGGKPYDLTFADDKLSGGIMQTLEATVGISIAF
jgi:hypothetical protein